MAKKILFIPNYSGQNLPKEGLERFDQVYLIPEKQDSLPINVVMQLLKFASESNIKLDLLQIDHSSNTELLVALTLEICKIGFVNLDTQITILSDDLNIDSLVNIARKNNLNVSRTDYSGHNQSNNEPVNQTISSVVNQESKIEAPSKPVQSPTLKPVSSVETPKVSQISAKEPEEAGAKNKRLISSLLNGNTVK
jgi:hypothetical protein